MRTATHTSWMQVDKALQEPIHVQIYRRYKQAIESGQLADGARVPSTRVLASALHVARGTVESAYAMLLGEGIFVSRGQAGCYVHAPYTYTQPAAMPVAVSGMPAPALPASVSTPSFVFLPGCPAYDAFPRKLWSRLAARRARSITPAELSFREPFGYLPLRQSIASYLRLSRGVSCEASQICITQGYQGGLDFLGKCLALREQTVWMEDPGYLFATQALQAQGARIVHIPVDEEGMVVAQGIAQAPHARLAIVTPSHHSPLGMALSWSRRMQLLDWASQTGAWVIEDDYDGEFRYTGYPLPALKSLDQYDRVIYAGSFSKTLFPALRLGYLVLPASLLATAQTHAALLSPAGPLGLQPVIHDLIAEGHFSRHLKRMRALYAERRDLTRQALQNVLGEQLRISTHKTGMHFVARLAAPHHDQQITTAFNHQGYGIHALSAWSQQAGQQGLIIGFTNVATAVVAELAARQLHDCFDRTMT